MAELLVRTIDKDQPDPYLACRCLGRGDIVVVCPDGWEWSKVESDSPHWTIIKIPGVAVDDFSHFMTEEPGNPVQDRMLLRRPFKLDLDAIDAKHGIDSKTEKTPPITEQKTFLDSLRLRRDKKPDPNVIK
jgi:hypothetical protein